MKFFVKDFCETVQARIVVFGMQVDNDVFYTSALKQWGLYWFTYVSPSIRPSFRKSVTLFCQRYLQNHLR